jgi:hypothetical protein
VVQPGLSAAHVSERCPYWIANHKRELQCAEESQVAPHPGPVGSQLRKQPEAAASFRRETHAVRRSRFGSVSMCELCRYACLVAAT